MAFDACMMRAVICEIEQDFPSFKIEKIFQPQNDEIDFLIRAAGVSKRLSFNVGAGSSRIQLSDVSKENPKIAPMFCMLLRKHLGGARLIKISQPNFDRIAEMHFSGYDELGDPTQKIVICEIMGKYANFILTDSSYKIISALKIITFADSMLRQIMPGIAYTYPQVMDKHLPMKISREVFDAAYEGFAQERTVEKFITQTFSGVATQIAHELCYLACGETDVPLCRADRERLWTVLDAWSRNLDANSYTPTVLYGQDGAPKEYSYMPITYNRCIGTVRTYGSICQMLDAFHAERDLAERMRKRARDLISLLSTTSARIERKLLLYNESLSECENAQIYKRRGDLITASIHTLRRGASKLVCTDYYEDGCPTVEIELDTRLSAAQNAQKMYKQYRKLTKAKDILKEQIAICNDELAYLDTVSAFLAAAECEDDLNDIRDELYRNGYASKIKNYKPKKEIKLRPIEYTTSSGMRVLVGRNNVQNDRLTFKIADKDDVWFHVKGMPGSHTVLITEGVEPSEADYTEAAEIAARHSSASAETVAVDYTRVRNVKKPQGAKPGFVIYKTNYTAYVRMKGDIL